MEYQNSPVQAVDRALRLLDRLALGDPERRGLPLADLARGLGLAPNTTHNLLRALVAAGYAAQPRRGFYAAGPKCDQIARVTRGCSPQARQRVQACLEALARETGESCVCYALIDGNRVRLGAVDSTQAVQVTATASGTQPFFGKPTGRVLAAFADAAEFARILERHGLPGADWDDIRDEATLRQELAAVRRRGWCRLASADGVVAIACAVPAAAGGAWGALGVYAPAFRCPPTRQAQLRLALQRAAAALGAVLGGP